MDLLIVSNSLEKDYFDKLYQLQLITPGITDFFVYTSDEFETMVSDLNLMTLEALSTDLIIYDKGMGKKYKTHSNELLNKNKIQKSEHSWKINK